MIQENYEFSCPSCGENLSTHLDYSGGTRQQFIQDCEVCCRPIQIKIKFENKEVTEFSADLSD